MKSLSKSEARTQFKFLEHLKLSLWKNIGDQEFCFSQKTLKPYVILKIMYINDVNFFGIFDPYFHLEYNLFHGFHLGNLHKIRPIFWTEEPKSSKNWTSLMNSPPTIILFGLSYLVYPRFPHKHDVICEQPFRFISLNSPFSWRLSSNKSAVNLST